MQDWESPEFQMSFDDLVPLKNTCCGLSSRKPLIHRLSVGWTWRSDRCCKTVLSAKSAKRWRQSMKRILVCGCAESKWEACILHTTSCKQTGVGPACLPPCWLEVTLSWVEHSYICQGQRPCMGWPCAVWRSLAAHWGWSWGLGVSQVIVVLSPLTWVKKISPTS